MIGNDSPLSIGGDKFSYDSLGGTIDDIQIHNRALTLSEVQVVANGSTVDSDLLAHYDF